MQPIIDRLESIYAENETKIERFFADCREKAAPYLYNSVDLRHSGSRIVPVDTNLFPAGFNNLSQAGRKRAANFMSRYVQERFPGMKSVLIVPETHTRNLAYLDNLHTLKGIVEQAGYEVVIGSLIAKEGEPLHLTSMSDHDVVKYPLRKIEGRLIAGEDFDADVIVLNNDCTAGIPEQLIGLTQPIMPPPELGWHARRKSTHFTAYHKLAKQFAEEFDFDPWLISAEFRCCGMINFKDKKGLDQLAATVDEVLAVAREKHKEYGITDEPYVFVKADSGTYGMGIMSVHSGEEILDINKKNRNKMQVIKDGAQVSEVIVQEGIPTACKVEGKPAEPLVYLADAIPVGGLYRINGSRDATGNLNALGVEFRGMCDEDESLFDKRVPVEGCRFRAFGLIASLAALVVPLEQAMAPAAKQKCIEETKERAVS